MLRVHVCKESVLEIDPLIIFRATRAFTLALLVLINTKSPHNLHAAGVVVGLQMSVELGVSVNRVLHLERYSAIEPTLDTRQVGPLHSEDLSFVCRSSSSTVGRVLFKLSTCEQGNRGGRRPRVSTYLCPANGVCHGFHDSRDNLIASRGAHWWYELLGNAAFIV
jgi:hypothetical protein